MPRQVRAVFGPDLATSAGREAGKRSISLRWVPCPRSVVGAARPRSSSMPWTGIDAGQAVRAQDLGGLLSECLQCLKIQSELPIRKSVSRQFR